METFLAQIALYFNESPQAVIEKALNYGYKLDDMIYILYLYRLNLKDPFLEHEFYANSLKKLGIKHIINTLYTIRTLLNTEENKETANIVMSDYGVNPPFVPR